MATETKLLRIQAETWIYAGKTDVNQKNIHTESAIGSKSVTHILQASACRQVQRFPSAMFAPLAVSAHFADLNGADATEFSYFGTMVSLYHTSYLRGMALQGDYSRVMSFFLCINSSRNKI